jgi:hypothetical protein
MTNTDEVKGALRDRVWRLLERERVVPEGEDPFLSMQGFERVWENAPPLASWPRVAQ